MSKVYNYDELGYFVNSQEALVNELGKEILPESSTFNKPLEEKDGFKIRWNGEAWVYEEVNQQPIYEPTPEEIANQKRSQRDMMLMITDRVMLPDYPITDAERERYKQYRQYLRDLPARQDFPNFEILSFAKWRYSSAKTI